MDKTGIDHRAPRIFLETDLRMGLTVSLPEREMHYLKNVLRRPDGAGLRVFNGRDGEYAAFLQLGRKSGSLRIADLIAVQPAAKTPRHLIFAPIRKERLDFLIEKAVELGVTHLHPVSTQHTSAREAGADRLYRQIVEAAEQCERLDIPALFPAAALRQFLQAWRGPDILAALERRAVPLLASEIGSGAATLGRALMIGPEGGFSDEEKDMLAQQDFVRPVSLGPHILRAETAALYGLSLLAAEGAAGGSRAESHGLDR
jgi:16S rRNA (uracil1498-N3)-methyltransferase